MNNPAATSICREEWALAPGEDAEGQDLILGGIHRYPVLRGPGSLLGSTQSPNKIQLMFTDLRLSSLQSELLDLSVPENDPAFTWHFLHLQDMPPDALPIPEKHHVALKPLVGLTLERMTHLKHLEFLACMSGLQELSIEYLPALQTLDGLAACTHLTDLHIGAAFPRFDSTLLRSCPNLRKLSLSDFQSIHLCPESLPALENLSIAGGPITWTETLGHFLNLKKLSLFVLDDLETLDFLRPLQHLEQLCVFGCEDLGNMDALHHLPALRRLRIDACPKIP